MRLGHADLLRGVCQSEQWLRMPAGAGTASPCALNALFRKFLVTPLLNVHNKMKEEFQCRRLSLVLSLFSLS